MPVKKSTLVIDGENKGALKAINQTTGSLGRAVGDVQKLGTGLGGALSGITGLMTNIPFLLGAAATAAVAGFGAMIKNSIDLADQLNKMSQSTGTSVEFLSKLQFAADLADVEIETIATSIQKLSRTLNDASNGLQTAQRPFDQLGIAVNDSSGKLRNAEDVIFDVADKFAMLEDGSQKTALSMEIFGRSGAKLIPLLNQGSKGLQEQFELAQKLGLEISSNTAKRAEEFNDNLTILGYSMKGAANVVAEELLPQLVSLSGNLVDVATNTNTVSILSEGLVNILKVLATVMIGLGAIVYELGSSLGVLGASIAKLLTLDFEGLAFVWKKGWSDVGEFAEATFDIMDALWSKGKDYQDVLAEINAAKEMEEHQLQIQKMAQEWEKVNKQINKDLIRETYGEIALQIANIDEKFTEYVSKFPAHIELITQWRDAMINAALDINKSVDDLLIRPMDILKQNQPLDNQQLSPELMEQLKAQSDFQIQEASRVTTEELAQWAIRQQFFTDSLANMSDAFGSLYQSMTNVSGKKHKELFAISKAFAIGEAVVNTYLGATKALAEIPPPFGFAVAASIVAAGLANVVRIASAQPGNASVSAAGGSAPSSPISNPTNNNDNRQIQYTINFYGGGFDEDKDKFARDLISSLNKAQEDGLIINRG